MKNKIGVIGAGAWGTAIAKLLSENKEKQVWLFVREQEIFENQKLIDIIKSEKENRKYLPNMLLENIRATASLEKTVADSEIIISAVPSEYLKETGERILELKEFIPQDAKFVSLTKGIEVQNGKFKRMSEVLQETIKVGKENIAVLSGPNIAYEIARGFPTATVIACENEKNSEELRELFNLPPFLRTYRSNDIIGVELGGALKNPYAIGAGICDYLIENGRIGENSKAAYLTRCLKEMKKFGAHLGGKEETFNGLSGLGDLSVTFNSKESRNHQVGYSLARGLNLNQIHENLGGKIAEGIRTCKNVFEYSQSINYDMNIMKQIYFVLYGEKKIKEAITDLMIRNNELE